MPETSGGVLQPRGFPSIRPGSKKGDPTVCDIRTLKYSHDGWSTTNWTSITTIQYCLNPRKADWGVDRHWTILSENGQPITEKEYSNLQFLKSVLPSWAHDFYDQLFHE
jgi:hypothetical protein